MRCHYEVLEVKRDADDETIKKSYRKLALKWHPDKNPENIEECTQYFALLQQAYEVLSDPHERAFYDRHRESFLKGAFDGDYKEESIDLFKYFTVSCFSGYGDDEKGFYTVYRRVFDTLSAEDYDFLDEEEERYPSFGNADSDYDKVVGRFYGFWSSFYTARSFAWLDHYDIRQAENRYMLRQIEAENKKYRDAGRLERSEQVRELVSFIRKRDPRVKKYREMLEQRQEEAKRKQEENRKQQILKNKQMMEEYVENEEEAARHREHLFEISQQLAEQFGESCSDEDEEGEEELNCVVCNKFFKTMNAKVNHEKSKQHKKQLMELKKHLTEEDALLFHKEEDEPADEGNRKGKKNKRKGKKKKSAVDSDDEGEKKDDPLEVDGEMEDLAKDAAVLNIAETADENQKDEPDSNQDAAEVQPVEPEKKEKKRRRANKTKQAGPVVEDNDVEEEEKVIPDEDTRPKTGKCDRCKEVFESRSKLFEHLKMTGHATLLINRKPEPKPKNKKGRRNRNDSENF